MSKAKRYFPLSNVFNDAERPVDSEIGPWTCSCDDEPKYSEFMEMHRSSNGSQKLVFRVSKFSYGRIDLGKCAILDKRQLTEIRDVINAHLADFEDEGVPESEEPRGWKCPNCASVDNTGRLCRDCDNHPGFEYGGQGSPG